MKSDKAILTVWIVTIFIMISCQEASKERSVIEKDEETLRYLKEIEWPRAYREQDTLLLDKILGEDFQLIDQSGGRYSKNDELNWIKEHAMEHDSFYYEIKRLDLFENGAAIIASTGHIFNDTTYSLYESSNVLIKRNGTWKAVLSHVSGYRDKQ